MTPDRAFVRNLRLQDRALEAKWNRQTERWEIWRRSWSPARLSRTQLRILVVQGAEGEYRPLDQRTLDTLRRADAHARGHQAILDEIEENNRKRRESEDRAFKNDMQALHKEHFKKFQRGAEELVGAANVPKEDLRRAVDHHIDAHHIDWGEDD